VGDGRAKQRVGGVDALPRMESGLDSSNQPLIKQPPNSIHLQELLRTHHASLYPLDNLSYLRKSLSFLSFAVFPNEYHDPIMPITIPRAGRSDLRDQTAYL
jgi:hypothetical protein